MLRVVRRSQRLKNRQSFARNGGLLEALESRVMFASMTHSAIPSPVAVNAHAVSMATTVSTTTLLTITPGTIGQGQLATVTATVSASDPSLMPTGSILFTVDGAAIAAPVTLANGVASAQAGLLPAGSSTVLATFLPVDGSYATSMAQGTLQVTNGITGGPGPGNSGGLTPTITRTGLPASVVAGSAVHASALVGVANASAVPIRGTATVQLFAAPNGALDGTETQIGSATAHVNLVTGRSQKVAVTITSLPASGMYAIVAKVTDPGGGTTTSTSGGTLTVGPSQVDLSGTFAKTPTAVKAGKTSPASILITNNGNSAAVGSLAISFEATSGDRLDSNAQSLTKAINLKPHKSLRVTLPVHFAAPGPFAIVAQLDPANVFSDVNVADNTFVSATVIASQA